MNFISLPFIFFCPLFFLTYYLVPIKYRYIVILIGSYIFYGYEDVTLLIFVIATTLITYFGGILIAKNSNKSTLILIFTLNIFILLIFKYVNFFIYNLNSISNKLGIDFALSGKNWLLPIGLSFYIFQSCTYLTDIYRKNIKAEKNLFLYASFVSFFPTILSGPIQKSRELIPQLQNPRKFNSEQAKKGTILFIWGFFEKILVANNLLIIINKVYGDISSYERIYYLLAAICFSIYIYADFSAYSDMARGISKIMGIEIAKNFDNPYLSISLSEFWNRWHISLNDWLTENIYIPLGGNRKGKLRKYINIMIVFSISGLWHGAQWHFVVWGIINGIAVIIGQILFPLKKEVYQKLKIDESIESLVFFKKTGVFIVITFTWIFFQNGISDSIHIVNEILHIRFIDFFTPSLLSVSGTTITTLIVMTATVFFCIIQIKRQKESYYYEKFNKQPIMFQIVVLAVLIVVCVFSIFSPYTKINTEFLYFQF